MDLGQKFNQLVKELEEAEKTRRDIVTNAKRFRLSEEGKLQIEDGFNEEELPLTDTALAHLCSFHKLPAGYFQRLIRQRPDLVASHVNYFFKEQPQDIDRFIRIKEGKIQAILSTRYVPYDHLDLLQTFQETERQLPELQLKKIDMDERGLNLRLTMPEHTESFGEDVRDLKDNIEIGVDLTNSEVGFRSAGVQPLLLRLVCTNGMRITEKGAGVQQRHLNFDPNIFRDRVSSAFGNAIDLGEKNFQELRRAQRIPFPLEENMEPVAKRHKIPKHQQEQIRENYQWDPDGKLYGFVNAITRTARDTKNFDARIELEETAHQVLRSN